MLLPDFPIGNEAETKQRPIWSKIYIVDLKLYWSLLYFHFFKYNIINVMSSELDREFLYYLNL